MSQSDLCAFCGELEDDCYCQERIMEYIEEYEFVEGCYNDY